MALTYRDKKIPHTHVMVELPMKSKDTKRVLYVGGSSMCVVDLPVDEFERVYERKNAKLPPMKHQ
jgi:hypothetical protein